MTQILGYGLIAVIVAALLFYGVVAFLPKGLLVPAENDQRPFVLPADRLMVREDLSKVRLPVALRGYKFAETDDLLDRLALELAARDRELERLRELEQQWLADAADAADAPDPAGPV